MQQERLTIHYRNHLLNMLQRALARVEGAAAVETWLQANPLEGPLQLVAVGKAAQSMAMGAERVLGERIARALIVSKHGHLDIPFCRRRGWEAIESGHPVPDDNSLLAGRRLLEVLAEGGDAPLLFLVSGGASSLLEAPVAGVDLDLLARTNCWLLGSGLDIVQMNRVRKGLSRIKGGGLLAWLAHRVVHALAISDVPGDRPAAIGSGLLVPEPDLPAQLDAMSLPDWLRDKVTAGLAQRAAPAQQVPRLHIVANLELAKQAAAEQAKQLGYAVTVHDAFLDGDAAETGRRLALELCNGVSGISIWGGETTVRLPAETGRGGRNQHLALAAAVELAGSKSCYLLAAGTDGTDGPTQDAGALVDGGTIARATLEKLDAGRALTAADAGTLLEASGDLVTTGPTGTNVMDLVIGLKA
jgi:glycerate 2-kinase